MRYDLQLLGYDGRLLASEPFWADDDQAAAEVATTVLQACNDIAAMSQVRRDKGLVAEGRCESDLLTRQPLPDRWQASAVEVVDRLERGFTAVGRSRRLLRATDELRRRGLL